MIEVGWLEEPEELTMLAFRDCDDDATFEVQQGQSCDEQDRRLGMDTYCLVLNACAHYGGLERYCLAGTELTFDLTAEAAAAIGAFRSITMTLESSDVEMVRVRLEQLLGPELNASSEPAD